jgi:uridine kinase
MSQRHPIIAITGSSGAGTTSVTRTFDNIFRREKVKAAIIEGDSFHRFDRKEMRLRQAEAEKAGNKNFSHFGSENNLFPELEKLFKDYSETGNGMRRKYLHDPVEAAPYKQEPGTFTAWEKLPDETDLLFYEGLHGAVVTSEVNVAKYPDLLIGVVPVINLEWIQKLYRDKNVRGYSADRHDSAAHARLRELHLPAVRAHARQFPARSRGRHQQPFHLARYTQRRREHLRDPLRQPEGHRLPIPAQHDQQLMDEPRQYHRGARRQDGHRDAAHLHALHLADDGTQADFAQCAVSAL